MLLQSLPGRLAQTRRTSFTSKRPCSTGPRTSAVLNGCRALCVSVPLQHRHRTLASARLVRTNGVAFEEAVLVPVYSKGELNEFPDSPGVYAVYDEQEQLQYIGVSRRLKMSVAGHLQDQAQYTHSIRYGVVKEGTREALTEEWTKWLEVAVAATNTIPPGNTPENTIWKKRAKATKPEVLLTAGKGITGITIEGLIDQVVKTCKVVAFIKGKRLQPQCGFSNRMLSMLNDTKVDYEVVDVLDEFHNPGLREAIKLYSQWPTIPQLYVNGEFVGGADIVEQLQKSGELSQILAASK